MGAFLSAPEEFIDIHPIALPQEHASLSYLAVDHHHSDLIHPFSEDPIQEPFHRGSGGYPQRQGFPEREAILGIRRQDEGPKGN